MKALRFSLFDGLLKGGWNRPLLWQLLLCGAVAFLSAKLVAVLIESAPYPPVISVSSAVQKARQSDLTLLANLDPFHGRIVTLSDVESVQDILPETELDLVLLGIRKAVDGGGSAIIRMKNGQQRAFHVKDEIQQGVRLTDIRLDHVVVSQNGRREILSLPNRRRGSGPTLVEKPSDVNDVVSFSPIIRNGAISGVEIQPARDRERFQALGLRPGDIIHAVNGVALDKRQNIEQLGNQLRSQKQIRLELERGGVRRELMLDLDRAS